MWILVVDLAKLLHKKKNNKIRPYSALTVLIQFVTFATTLPAPARAFFLRGCNQIFELGYSVCYE